MKEILGYKIGKLAQNIKKFVDKYLSEVNLGEGQYLILRSIRNNSDISQKEISLELNINKATTTKSIKKLIDNGYITREINPNNLRCYKLICSEKSKKVLKEINNLIEIEKMILTNEIDKEELDIFFTVLKKMNNNMLNEFNRDEKRSWR